MPLWTAALLAAAGCALAAGSRELSTESRLQGLVETLRRQLMRDNSDYSLETPVTAGAARVRAEPEDAARGLASNYYVSKLYQGSNGHDDYLSNHKQQQSGHRTNPELPVSKKDLLYYIDDDKLVSEKSERTYKTLKGSRRCRRSGQNVFILEEGPGAVAVVSLGGAPAPAVRLPGGRRAGATSARRQRPRGAADHVVADCGRLAKDSLREPRLARDFCSARRDIMLDYLLTMEENS